MSIAHEIEHDAIHRLYFTRNKRAQHVMFAVVLAAAPLHDQPVGPAAAAPAAPRGVRARERDLEEQGITNGQPWSLKRVR